MRQVIRSLSAAEAYDKGVRGVASTGNVDAPAVQIATAFTYQSYFDDTLLQRAILPQKQGEPIVTSTKQTVSIAGYALALHPSSKSPVAVRFSKGGQQGDSTTYVLKPGQLVRPVGFGDRDQRFSGFDYGLPFGWLGGGEVTLLVLRSPDADVQFIDRTEIIFHRQRVKILDLASVPDPTAIANWPYNWPLTFPWAHAFRDTIPQQGSQGLLTVTPTRVAMSLRMADLASAETMRAYYVGTNDFAMDSSGNVSLTDVRGYDIVWGTWASLASPNLPTQYQYQFLPPEAFMLNGDDGALLLVETTPGTLVDEYVDVVRYGVL